MCKKSRTNWKNPKSASPVNLKFYVLGRRGSFQGFEKCGSFYLLLHVIAKQFSETNFHFYTSEQAKRTALRTVSVFLCVFDSQNMRFRFPLAEYAFRLKFDICSWALAFIKKLSKSWKFHHLLYFLANASERSLIKSKT